MAKLNANAQKWVDALRSGKYQQGRDQLCADGRYCCLGVLCEVAVDNGLELEVQERDGERVYGGRNLYPPNAACSWAGLKDDRATYAPNTNLAARNDEGYSFEQIADLIERYAEELGVAAQ